MSRTIERAVVVHKPVREAYDQWTQFEEFDRFMPGVERIEQVGDDAIRATVKRRGVERTFDARITEQIPDARIAWESVDERPQHAGVVTFHRITDRETKVLVQLEFWPTGVAEHYADMAGMVSRWVDDALDGYREFLEARGRPTGAWRGIIGREDLENGDGRAREGERREETPTSTATEPGRTPAREATPLTAHGSRSEIGDPPPSGPTDDGRGEGDRPHGSEQDPEVRQMADGEIVIDTGR